MGFDKSYTLRTQYFWYPNISATHYFCDPIFLNFSLKSYAPNSFEVTKRHVLGVWMTKIKFWKSSLLGSAELWTKPSQKSTNRNNAPMEAKLASHRLWMEVVSKHVPIPNKLSLLCWEKLFFKNDPFQGICFSLNLISHLCIWLPATIYLIFAHRGHRRKIINMVCPRTSHWKVK